MGVGMLEWQALNRNRGKFYAPMKKTYRAADSIVDFPLFGSNPFDTGTTVTRYDVATNAASQAWQRALAAAASGNTETAERLKDQIVRGNTEQVINALGYQYLNSGYSSIAADIFTRNVAAHQDSWNAYFSLAEAQGARGDTLSAVANYNKALNLAPTSAQKTTIQNRIKRLLG